MTLVYIDSMKSIKSTCDFKTFNLNDLSWVITQAGWNIIHTIRNPNVLTSEENKASEALWKQGGKPRETVGPASYWGAKYGSSEESTNLVVRSLDHASKQRDRRF